MSSVVSNLKEKNYVHMHFKCYGIHFKCYRIIRQYIIVDCQRQYTGLDLKVIVEI